MRNATRKSEVDGAASHSFLWRAATLLAALVGVGAAQAAPKTDIIELKNGDRLTGEFKGLEQGLVTLKTDALDTVYVKWEQVRSLRTKQYLQIEVDSGRRYYGTAPEAEEAQVGVRNVDTGEQQVVPFSEVVRIDPIERGMPVTLMERLSASCSKISRLIRSSSTFCFRPSFSIISSLN